MKPLSKLSFILIAAAIQYSFAQSNLWQKIDESLSVRINTLVIDHRGRLWAGADIAGVWFSDDCGKTWQLSGLPERSVGCLAIDSQNKIWAGAGGAYGSFDYGNNWFDYSDYLPTRDKIHSIGTLLTDKNNDVLAISFGRLYFSQYRGNNEYVPWREVFIPAFDAAVAINSKNHIFVGLMGGKLAISYDDTKNWVIRDPGVKFGLEDPHSVVINSKDQIFYSMGWGDGDHWVSCVYRTDDDGRTFMILDPSTGGLEMRWYAVRLYLAKNDWLFAAGDPGKLVFSTDNGDTWQNANSGLEERTVWTLISDAVGNIYVGTDYGIYHTTFNLLTKINHKPQVLSKFELQQNYPNPFNSQTVIRYQIEKPTHLCLAIFDLNGRLVRTLFDNPSAPGLQEILWDGTNDDGSQIASGIYILKMQTPDFTDYKKLMFVK